MAGDWFAADTSEVDEVDTRFGGEEEEVVEYAFGQSDSESESKTDKLRELLRDDSSKDMNLGGSKGGSTSSLPNVDLNVYAPSFTPSSRLQGTKVDEGKGRPRLGRRAAGGGSTGADEGQSSPTKLEKLRTTKQKRSGSGESSSTGLGYVTNNSLYVSPTKSSPRAGETFSPRQEKSASSVTGEWSLDMDQMLPDNTAKPKQQGRWQDPKARGTARDKDAGESDAMATSKASAFDQKKKSRTFSKPQEKLPDLAKPSASPAPKMTMSAGYQPSFMTRTIEVEDSRSAPDVSESIGMEYSEDFESSRSSLSPTRFSEAVDDSADSKFGATKLPSPSAAPVSAEARAKELIAEKVSQLMPKGKAKQSPRAQSPVRSKAADKPPTTPTSSSSRKVRKKTSSSAEKKAKSTADRAEVSTLRTRIQSLEAELDAARSQKIRESARRAEEEKKGQLENFKFEIEELRASLGKKEQESAKLKTAFDEKKRSEAEAITHAKELEEKVISLNEDLRAKDDIHKSIVSFDGNRNAKRLLTTAENQEAVEIEEFHPVIIEFLEEIRSSLQDERTNLKKEQERLDKLVSSVNQDKESYTRQTDALQSKEREIARMEQDLRREKSKMATELELERDKIKSEIDAERSRLRTQIDLERQTFTDRVNSDRKKMELEKETLQRNIRQLKSEEDLLKVKIKRLDDEFAHHSDTVKEQRDLAERLRQSAQAEKHELQKSREEIVTDNAKGKVTRCHGMASPLLSDGCTHTPPQLNSLSPHTQPTSTRSRAPCRLLTFRFLSFHALTFLFFPPLVWFGPISQWRGTWLT